MSPHFRAGPPFSCKALLRLEDPGVPHGKGGVADQVPWEESPWVFHFSHVLKTDSKTR